MSLRQTRTGRPGLLFRVGALVVAVIAIAAALSLPGLDKPREGHVPRQPGLHFSGGVSGDVPSSYYRRSTCQTYAPNALGPGAEPRPVFSAVGFLGNQDFIVSGVGYWFRWSVQPYHGFGSYSLIWTAMYGSYPPDQVGVEMAQPRDLQRQWQSTTGTVNITGSDHGVVRGTIVATLAGRRVSPAEPAPTVQVAGHWTCTLTPLQGAS